uniref:Putative secreted protein n=1 Tax=Panstrongylus lignarius TaxID=156445 RepID=A0A224Y075_9HEMI
MGSHTFSPALLSKLVLRLSVTALTLFRLSQTCASLTLSFSLLSSLFPDPFPLFSAGLFTDSSRDFRLTGSDFSSVLSLLITLNESFGLGGVLIVGEGRIRADVTTGDGTSFLTSCSVLTLVLNLS